MKDRPVRPIPCQLRRSDVGRSLRLALLGAWSLHADGANVAMSANGQRLLSFLALRGRTPRDHVAGVLWPENDDQSALANLRTTLWRVRRRVPGAIIGNQQEIELAPQMVVDVHGLISAGQSLTQNSPAEVVGLDCTDLGRALARHAALLPGWYEDWVEVERERLQQLQVHALEVAAERLVQTKQLATALEVAQAATTVEPFRESAHRAVVTVLLHQANTAQALRHYQRYEQLLDRELGIEPSNRLQELIRPLWKTGVRL